MFDYVDLIYTKTKTEISGLIWLGAVYEENQIGKWHDWSYKCGLR